MQYKLNLGCGKDRWGTHRLDWKDYGQTDVKIFDLNSGKRLPYPNETFSEIRLYGVLPSLLYPQKVLEECNRVLKKGGVLDMSFADSDSLYFKIFPIHDAPVKFTKHLYNNGHTYSMHNTTMIKNRLEKAGFKAIAVSKCNRHLVVFNIYVHIISKKVD